MSTLVKVLGILYPSLYHSFILGELCAIDIYLGSRTFLGWGRREDIH